MSIETGKITPLILFLGGIGYALWPYIDSPRPISLAEGSARKADEIAFRPEAAIPTRRDPFVTNRTLPASAAKPAAGKAGAVAVKSKGEGEKKAAPGPPRNQAIDGLAEGLRLGATVVGERKQAAVINGRLYLLGDVVNSSDSSPNSWKVVGVSDGGVLLADRLGKRVVTLGFRPKASTQPAAQAKEDRAGSPAEIMEIIGVMDRMMGTDFKSMVSGLPLASPVKPGGGR